MSIATTLRRYWEALDALLRGRFDEPGVAVIKVWTFWQIVGAALYGVALGVYSVANRDVTEMRFLFSGAVKMPLLLLLTTLITCPSLYVFGVLQGLRFTASQFGSMLIVAHTVLAAVLGSLAPVLAFFSVTTRSYSFMVLSVVMTCALAGAFGLRWFLKVLRGPVTAEEADTVTTLEDGDAEFEELSDDDEAPPPLRAAPKRTLRDARVWRVLGWWLLLYGFVGVQLGWILRPFIGRPSLEFEWFRQKEGSFIEAVFEHLRILISG